jgi:DNA-binding SARP family transcriptional activator
MATSRRSNTPGANAPLTLRLLGGAALSRSPSPSNAAEPVPLVGKQFALVAYLACAPDRSATRARLTDLFARGDSARDHPDGERRAGDAVRNLIQQLRQKLGADALGSHRADPVRLSAEITTDRDELLAAWERHDFQAVVRAYGGEFLPRFDTLGSAEFAHWVEGERADLGRRFTAAARRAIEKELSAAPDPDALRRALHIATRLRDHDDLDQESWQLLLRCLILCGRHSEALFEADRLQRMLGEAGATPNAATQRVLALARADAARGLGDATTAERAGRRQAGDAATLVGRAQEVAVVLAAWERALGGAFSHVHVFAPPGLGKTGLLADVRQRVRARPAGLGRAHACEARASHASRDVAYAFAGELAQALAERPGGLGVPESVATTLVALNPRLGSVYRAAPRTGSSAGGLPHAEIERALRELIAAVALEGPLAIFLDDLHWSDEPSLRALAGSLHACADLPVLVVSAARDSCDALCASTGGRQLELGRLGVDSTA